MTVWGRGAKAGLVAGGIWGIVTAVETAVSVPTGAALPTIVVFVIIRLAWGLILGLVFAAVVDRYESARSYRAQGVVYGLILGIIELALNLGSLGTGVTNVGVNLALGLASSLVFGYILGYSYEKFAPRPPPTIQEPSFSSTSKDSRGS